MSVTIRSVENETELEKVFDLLHQANPSTPREYFSARVQSEPNFELWQTRIAADDDKVVATIQIFDKKMWLNGRAVRFGGLGHLAVSPDYKSAFELAELLQDTLDMLKEFGYVLSVVFTEDNDFYLKFGFAVMPSFEYAFEKFAAYDTTGIRPFDRAKDFERVMEIHEEFNSLRNGPVCRTQADWEAQTKYHADDPEAFCVLEREGDLSAYIRGKLNRGIFEILEFGAHKSYAAYFRRILTVIFEKLNFYSAKISLRRDEPFFNASYIPAKHKQDSRMMWAVLNQQKLAENLGFQAPDEVEKFMKDLRDFQTTFWRTDVF
jgi:predicted acetyltransferase